MPTGLILFLLLIGVIASIETWFLMKKNPNKKRMRKAIETFPTLPFSGLTPLQDINMDEDDRNEWSLEHEDDC